MCVAGQPDGTRSSDYSKLSTTAMPNNESDNVFIAAGGGGGDDSSLEVDPDCKQQQQQVQEELMGHDQGSGFVVFGAFVAGALVGIIVCAPVFVVLLLGTGAAALTSSDSKAGKFSRKVGKVSADVLIAVCKKARQLNETHQVTHRASEAAKQSMARAKTEVQKRDLGDRIKARASAMWTFFEQRTAPSAREAVFEEGVATSAPVTDGTQLPFDGSAGEHDGKTSPKIFHT